MTILNKKCLKKININIFIIFSFFFISQNIFAELTYFEKVDLFYSIHDENMKKLEDFLHQKGDPNITFLGHTLLDTAILHRNLEAVNLLLHAGADTEITDSNGDTPLLHLTNRSESFITEEKEKDIQILKALLAAGANPNKVNSSQHTPLFNVTFRHKWNLAMPLLQNKADPFFDFDKSSNFIKKAINEHNSEIIKTICHNPFFTKNISFDRKKDLLLSAIQNDFREIIPTLMTSGPKVPLKIIKPTLEKEFLPKAFNRWRIAANSENIPSNNVLSAMIAFISILTWYRYETHQLQKFNFNFQKNIPESVKNLLEEVNHLNNRTFFNDTETYAIFTAAKNVIDWIIKHRFTGTRPEEFFKEFAKYFQKNRHEYEKFILSLTASDLILKEYFLNPNISNKSDFFKLKEPLNDFLLAQAEEMKANLRLMYAKELKDRFLFFTPEMNLIKTSNLHQLNHFNVSSIFNNFDLIKQKEKSMISYCQDTSSPLVKFVSDNTHSLKNQEIAQWVKNVSDKEQTSMKLFVENLLGQHNQNVTKQLHEFSEHLDHIIQTEGKDIHSKTIFSDKDILDFESKK